MRVYLTGFSCRIRSICWMPDMQTKFVEADGLRFEVLEQGTGVRLALCLHGFPEHAISWRHQIPVLAGMGWSLTARPAACGYPCPKPEASSARRETTLQREIAVKKRLFRHF